ncbi:unnamed protein product [Symbiodinium sp. CCMP2592]|nr:unnamed protein product [Symbiodinium sp. CCMP2592]
MHRRPWPAHPVLARPGIRSALHPRLCHQLHARGSWHLQRDPRSLCGHHHESCKGKRGRHRGTALPRIDTGRADHTGVVEEIRGSLPPLPRNGG